MTATTQQVSVCHSPQRVTLRVRGRMTMKESPPFRKFGEQCLRTGLPRVRVDLGECTYMDSTFLGTLLFLQRTAERRPPAAFTLVAPSAACRELLRQLGLEEIFRVEDVSGSDDGDWSTLEEACGDRDAFKRCVVDAHQELAATPGKAAEAFGAIARNLSAEFEAKA